MTPASVPDADPNNPPVTAAGRCATCCYWVDDSANWRLSIRLENLPDETNEEAEQRAHEAEELFRRCEAIDLLDGYEKVETVPLAFTKDGSDYMASLFTQAEFGCALWKAQDAT